MRNEEPMVTVVMITYGHENYIEKAIHGVFMQKTSFPVELIIANDCSPDNTDDVVENLLALAPLNITVKYTRHKNNLGMISNFVWALKQGTGKFIAVCEGDDYWTDPLKLQKQVDFLEKNDKYVLSFTQRDILNNDILEITEPLNNKTSFCKTEIPSIYVPTLTVVFRNLMNKMPDQMNDKIIDGSLFLFLSQFGLFHCLPEKTAVYRKHDDGMWSGNSNLNNYTRSVDVRLAAWKHFPNIDRVSLAHTLVNWIRLKKIEERIQKMHWSALRSVFQEYYFISYILFYNLLSKNNH